MREESYVNIKVGQVMRESAKAWLFKNDGWSEPEAWFPKSQLKSGQRIAVGDKNLTVAVTEWIAEQKKIKMCD